MKEKSSREFPEKEKEKQKRKEKWWGPTPTPTSKQESTESSGEAATWHSTNGGGPKEKSEFDHVFRPIPVHTNTTQYARSHCY